MQFSTSHAQSHFNPNPHKQQQHQQRPPIHPTHQPRLHHSISAGNISMVANANRYGSGHGNAAVFGGGHGSNSTTGATPPKKKDPYATAWRTYSKIAEELQLLNPDGSLYPISKEAIMKYLHHQSKRIKSSNLHWYVNGLKKHQENLGFPWDDVRYDEQVVSLLKELTLHPVSMVENGDEDGPGHAYGSQPNRQRQNSTGMHTMGKSGHHYTSSSIDTTRIANLSISQPPLPQHHSHQQQQHYHSQQQAQNSTYGGAGLKQQRQSHQHYWQQQQPPFQHSQRTQQPPPPKPYYHSAPIQMPSRHTRTPSTQEYAYPPGINQSIDSHAMRPDPMGKPTSALTKRKHHAPSSMNIGGEGDDDDDELQEDDLKNDDEEFGLRRAHGIDDSDDQEEDSNRYQPLKRRASTGTLLSQARASAVNHVPGSFALDSGETSSHLYQKTMHGNSYQRGNHLRSPSPDARESPPDSASSISTTSGSPHHTDTEPRRFRHASGDGEGLGDAPSPITGSTLESPSTSAAVPETAGKTTVQFSEVVECAQLLQEKYGNRCKHHPWGCVEITEERHLELTIKMYLDWAGLVASGRLTMDELPDLPEFRNIHSIVGGTLKRMASTPLASLMRDEGSSPVIASSSSPSHRLAITEDPTSTRLGRNYSGPYRSPSSSPPINRRQSLGHHADLEKDLVGDDDRIRPSSPPLGGQGRDHLEGPVGRSLSIRARKMPSTPSLRQRHRDGHALMHRHLQRRPSGTLRRQGHHLHSGSIVSNSTASSPPSEDDISDEENECEAIDQGNYALTPWATVSMIRGPHFSSRLEKYGNVSRHEERSDFVAKEKENGLDNKEVEDEEEEDATAIMMDTEHAIAKIGEIAEASGVQTTVDMSDGTSHDDRVSVETTAQGLDSMVIGSESIVVEGGKANAADLSQFQTGLDKQEQGQVHARVQEHGHAQGHGHGHGHGQEVLEQEDSVMMET
ncbi:hypothetical protein BGZ51_004652 [Haplosporangium sp. Z 767]|nr:hypothetical protein BGZ51_004652 [Haplosporangium sp. Z 767]